MNLKSSPQSTQKDDERLFQEIDAILRKAGSRKRNRLLFSTLLVVFLVGGLVVSTVLIVSQTRRFSDLAHREKEIDQKGKDLEELGKSLEAKIASLKGKNEVLAHRISELEETNGAFQDVFLSAIKKKPKTVDEKKALVEQGLEEYRKVLDLERKGFEAILAGDYLAAEAQLARVKEAFPTLHYVNEIDWMLRSELKTRTTVVPGSKVHDYFVARLVNQYVWGIPEDLLAKLKELLPPESPPQSPGPVNSAG